jgi:lysophospholipase L1-like esterase
MAFIDQTVSDVAVTQTANILSSSELVTKATALELKYTSLLNSIANLEIRITKLTSSPLPTKTYKVMFVGDSITQGNPNYEGSDKTVSDGGYGYTTSMRGPTIKALRDMGYKIINVGPTNGSLYMYKIDGKSIPDDVAIGGDGKACCARGGLRLGNQTVPADSILGFLAAAKSQAITPDIIFLQGGTNDWSDGVGATVALDRYKQCYDYCKAQWPLAKIILVGVLPADWLKLTNVELMKYVDGVATMADNVRSFAARPFDQLNSTIFNPSAGVHTVDGTHLNFTGATIVATNVYVPSFIKASA